ncbi:DUF1801 domain-containing protein [[Eubacterium] cellulosolvens]
MGKYNSINDYIMGHDKDKGAIVKELVSIVNKAAPKENSGIKWSQPVFWNSDGPFCFIRAHKNHVNIGFWRGAQLKDPKGLLEGSGEKMRHIKITSKQDIDEKAITDFVKQGVNLNKKFGDPSRQK